MVSFIKSFLKIINTGVLKSAVVKYYTMLKKNFKTIRKIHI